MTGFESEFLILAPIEDNPSGPASVRVTRESHDGRGMLHVRIVAPDGLNIADFGHIAISNHSKLAERSDQLSKILYK